MSLEENNSSQPITQIAFNPLFVTLEVSQQLSTIIYGNMRNLYDAFSLQNKEEDPFKETKKKCLPETIDHLPMDERLEIRMQNTYYSSTPLTIEKRDGPSFADKTMNNLIIDTKGNLIQLLCGIDPSGSVPNWQRIMQVTEYKFGRRTLARKFERYI